MLVRGTLGLAGLLVAFRLVVNWVAMPLVPDSSTWASPIGNRVSPTIRPPTSPQATAASTSSRQRPRRVLVVGLASIYAWVSYFLGNSPLTLAFAFVVLVLPFAYRAIDAGLSAIDIVTLAEAARSLGSSWLGVLLRIVVPNIRGAIMSASLISVALVLGEFTISSLLNYDTLQVVINLLGKRNAALSVAVSLAALVFAFLLLFGLANIAPRRGGRALDEVVPKGLAT